MPCLTRREWDRFWKGCKPNSVCPALLEIAEPAESSSFPRLKTSDVRQLKAGLGRESFVSAADTRNPSHFRETGAGRSRIPYLALHPMGFSVPRRLRSARCALTTPFHPCQLQRCCNLGGFILCGTVRRDGSRHRRPRVSQPFLKRLNQEDQVDFISSPVSWPHNLKKGWVTRHRALWCSDFPPPSCSAGWERFSALPKPIKFSLKRGNHKSRFASPLASERAGVLCRAHPDHCFEASANMQRKGYAS